MPITFSAPQVPFTLSVTVCPLKITTLSPEVGTPLGLQVPAVFQLPVVTLVFSPAIPVVVNARIVMTIKRDERIVECFIGVSLFYIKKISFLKIEN